MRRSIRLKGYDYSRAGAYFVTICVRNKQCLFGHIENTDMLLNEAGKMVQTVWNKIPQYYKSIEIDAFTIMPNHIHGIIRITNQDNFNMSQNITKSVGVELGRTGDMLYQSCQVKLKSLLSIVKTDTYDIAKT